ncbi:MAG: PDZ domain-containing protein [Dehalococcoidia bacterium]|nr:MAG: PDZ domain-containing protein [Dehalococcoidia bacterium]
MNRAKIKYVVACFILVLSLLLGTSCQIPDIDIFSPPSSSPPTTTIPINPDWTLPQEDGGASLLPSIADVVAVVKPSVVAINTETVTLDIFNRPSVQEGAGSGWIIDGDGIIVTNNHVVEGAEMVTVTLSDGRTFAAETIRTDSLSDLAVIKIDAQNLPAASIGDSSQLRVGDWVVAIGNPLGLGISAKEGIVSRLEVSIVVSSGQMLYDLIETSAAINPGNSGGPLVNLAGEVIGITSIKIATVGVEGMGYAISINTAESIIEQLIKVGYVVRPYLGVVVRSVDQYVISRYDLEVDEGAFITEVAAGSPADEAGIEASDVIVSLDGKKIATAQDLIQAIHSSQIGQKVKIILWRGGSKNTTHAVLVESPSR